jgi:hypothetical protein
MKTDDVIKYLLLGLGVYLVWEYVLSPMITGVTTPSTIPQVSQTPNVLTSISTATPAVPVGPVSSILPGSPMFVGPVQPTTQPVPAIGNETTY